MSIHKALHSLEEGVGCLLFIKEGRQLKPLPAATYLAEASVDLLGDVERILKKVRSKAGVESRQIRLGSMYSLTANIIPRMIMGIKIRRPDLDIDLYLGSNEELLKKLYEGTIDAVVIAAPSEELLEELEAIHLFEDDLYLASSKGNKPKAAEVDLSEYEGEKFLTLQEGFATTSGFLCGVQIGRLYPEYCDEGGRYFFLNEYGVRRHGSNPAAW